MNPLVSVIVPVYNMEDNLKKCVYSVINQTYQNIEIILINDGSIDNSKQIIDSFVDDYSYIRAVHKDNEGVSTARNIGIDKSTGEYLMFVDPDDSLDSDIISLLLKESISKDADIVVCGAQVELNSVKKKNSFFKESGVIEKKRAIAQLFSNEYYKDSDKYIDVGVPWGKIYRKKYIMDYNLKFNPKLRRNQDNIFNLYAFQYANKITYIDLPLYNYDIDHYKSGARKVKFDAEELNRELAKEVIKFYKKYYSEDDFFYKLLLQRLSTLLINLLTTKLCNPKFDIDYHNRIKKIKDVCEMNEFKIIFENKIYASNYKHKLILSLLKNKRYSATYTTYLMAFKLGF